MLFRSESDEFALVDFRYHSVLLLVQGMLPVDATAFLCHCVLWFVQELIAILVGLHCLS